MDFTLVLHSRDIDAIGLGDITDPLTCAGPMNTVPHQLLPSTITLRFELFSDVCPLASQNLSFVANRHLIADDADVAGAAAFAKESCGYRSDMSTHKTVALPLGLKETTVLRLDKSEAIEFGVSATDSVFEGTYNLEGLNMFPSSSPSSSSASAAPPVFTTTNTADPRTPADSPGFLVVSNFGGANSNASRYFITLKPMKHILGNHTVLGRVRLPDPTFLGGIGNGFDRLRALMKHPQFKVNAKTCIPLNKVTIAESVVFTVPPAVLKQQQQAIAAEAAAASAASGDSNAKNSRLLKSRLAGKQRGREDEEEADMLREEFEKGGGGGDNDANNTNPFANPAAFANFDPSAFGAVDSRVRTTKKRRVEKMPLLSTAPLSLLDRERLATTSSSLRSVAVPTAQRFEGHDDAREGLKGGNSDSDEDEDNWAFKNYLPKKVFGASVTAEEIQSSYRPVGVKPEAFQAAIQAAAASSNNGSSSTTTTFNLFEANAMTYSSDLREVLEQQLERHHNRERRIGRKKKALEKQQAAKFGGAVIAEGGSAADALKAALASTKAAAQLQSVVGGLGGKAGNKVKSAMSNVTEKLGRIREKFARSGNEHSVKAFQERAKAKAVGAGKVGKRY